MTPVSEGAVVVVSSHVARGTVGNRVIVFALERLGFTTWAVPTIILPYHLGQGPADRIVPDELLFAKLLELLLKGDRASGVAAVISGFLASPQQADAVAAFVETVKAARPDALYLCDPVIGDLGHLYVSEVVAVAVRDRLLPLADLATPNAFECAWLAGASNTPEPDLATLARRLGPNCVLVTSAPALMRGHIGNLLVEPGSMTLFEHPALPTPAKGTGDVVAALLVARRLQGHSKARAAELAVASAFEIVAATVRAGADELLLPECQHSLAQPHASVSVRRIMG